MFEQHTNKWFLEKNQQWPHQALSLEVETLLYDKSQNINIFKFSTIKFGEMFCY